MSSGKKNETVLQYIQVHAMAKLYFYYSAMGSGKSALLLQAAFNYNERGMAVEIFIPQVISCDMITSRIGLTKKAHVFDPEFNFMTYMATRQLHCIMIDEAQFLTKKQVFQLAAVADQLGVPVLCYGLRSDFQAEPFEGSMYLLCLADKLVELKTICKCGSKATMNMRVAGGMPVFEGPQVDIGGDEKYTSLCRKCYYMALHGPSCACGEDTCHQ